MSAPSKSYPRDSTLLCVPATIDDIPDLSSIFLNTFTGGVATKLFPPTAAVRQWWDDANTHDLLHNPSSQYIVVRDLAANDGKGKVIGYIKWVVPVHGVGFKPPPRFPSWPDKSDKTFCDEYFGALEREKWKHIKQNQDYWIDMFCTLPEHQGRGAGTLMLEWGCKRADDDGVKAYVNATEKGRSTYERFGFKMQNKFVIRDGMGGMSCVREPQPRGETKVKNGP